MAKALTALAGYLRRGVKEIGVEPNPSARPTTCTTRPRSSATRMRSSSSPRLYLSGGGGSEDVKRGMHYLSVLTEESYPGAQALLADLFWRGRYVKKDEQRALALITMAVENAPAHERIWIEDIYQNIFCGTSQGTRKQADGIVAVWRKMFAPPVAAPADRMGLACRELQPRAQMRQRRGGRHPPRPATSRRGGGRAATDRRAAESHAGQRGGLRPPRLSAHEVTASRERLATT